MHDFEPIRETLSSKDVDGSTYIHPAAQVAKGAELGKGVFIGAGAVIGPLVRLADNVKIAAYAQVMGRTSIGKDTHVYAHATIGSVPQDLKFGGEDSQCIIGEGNKIREYVNISLGTAHGSGKTVIGNNNLIMVYTHIAHDCVVGNDCIFANSVQVAGHVEIGNKVVFGGISGAHQWARFGDFVMVAAGAMVSQDAPPYCIVHGNHARAAGINFIGLKRANNKNIRAIKTMYRIVFNENMTLEDALRQIETEVEDGEERQTFVRFIRNSKRGICR